MTMAKRTIRFASWERVSTEDRQDPQSAATTRQMIADCDAKMARYRAAIDAGGDLEEITGWINEAKAERRLAEAALRATYCAPTADPGRDQGRRGPLRQPGRRRPER